MSPSRSARRALLSAALATAPALAQTPASSTAAPVRVAAVEGITEYRLANGLKLLLFPDQTKPQTTVNITYLVGSRQEGYGETGMAHLLEHMLYKGSTKHLRTTEEITGRGATYNASTSFDRTNFYETFAAADSNLAWALDLEADRMLNSFVRREDLDKEFSVVRNEYESGENNPFSVTLKRVLATSYHEHNYRHLTIGSKSDIENVPIERLQAFYHKYYQPDNAVLMIAGNFDEKRALRVVQEKFGIIARPARQLDQTYTVEPTQDGERVATVRRAGDAQVVLAYYHVPAGGHPDFAAIDVLARMMGDPPSGRLYKALVETKLAASVNAQDLQLHDPGGIFFAAQVRKQDSMGSVETALLSTIQEVATAKPPTSEEVERAKATLLKNIDLALTRSGTIGLELSEWEGMGDWRLYFVHRDRIRKVTSQDVQRVASYYLKPSNRTLGYFVPTDNIDRTAIAASPNIDSLVKDYKGQAAVAAGEAFDATPTNIESRVKRMTLASGLKLALLSKKTRGEAVTAVITLRFGTEQSLTDRMSAAALTAQLLTRGTTTLGRQQLRDTLDKLKARMATAPLPPGGVRLTIETTRPNLPAVMTIAGQVLRAPAFDAKEFEQLQREATSTAESQRSEPVVLGQLAYIRQTTSYPKGHPRFVATLDEQIANVKALTVADIKKYYGDFYGASNGELVVVGDFDTDQVAKEAADLFGDWKSPKPFKPVPAVLLAAAPGKQSIETPDKANAFFIAGENFAMKDDDPDYPALALANYILGEAPLNSRLVNRIRVKDGLSYTVQGVLNVSALDNFGQIFAVAIYAPQNADKVEGAYFEEIRKAVTDGFTADEIEKAKTGMLEARKVQRSSDPVLAGTLANDLYLGRTLMGDAAFEQKVAALTPAQVNAALKRVLDPAKITIVKAGDFVKAKEAGAPKP